MNDTSIALRALSRLLSYPGEELRAALPAIGQALARGRALRPVRRDALLELVRELGAGDHYEIEARYVDTFDRGRRNSLYLFEHVHGDSRERGPAMVDLLRTYEAAGLHLPPGELPDYLPVALEFASTQPAKLARAFLGEIAHILNAIHAALARSHSPYAAAIAAAIELAGERVQPVRLPPEEPLDAAWAEPAAFDGCATRGQAPPAQPQPVRFVDARRDNQVSRPGVQP